jgi:hypothetical protein
MPDFRRIGAVALVTAIALQLLPPKVNAQAAAAIVPVGAAIVILGGISYYVWTNSQGVEQRVPVYPVLEDPEDEAQWGVFDARDERHCQRLAGGRDYRWLGNGKCRIKG